MGPAMDLAFMGSGLQGKKGTPDPQTLLDKRKPKAHFSTYRTKLGEGSDTRRVFGHIFVRAINGKNLGMNCKCSSPQESK